MDYADIAPMMGQLWSPIAAVTSSWRGRDNAQIAVAIGGASIVPDQPRVVVQIYKRNFSHNMIYRGGVFVLNFLRQDQLQPIHDFGLRSGRIHQKLEGYDYEDRLISVPVLRDCWGYLECLVVNAMDGGDMTCFLADVVAGNTLSDGPPLTWSQAKRDIPAEWAKEWEQKISKEIHHSAVRMEDINFTPYRRPRLL